MSFNADLYPLITRDPASGDELVVTRLECPSSGVVIEGNFSLGWIGKLTPEQIDLVGLLLKNRNNLQRLANDLGVAYNTARSRLDEIVTALGGEDESLDEDRSDLLDKVSSGELSVEDALSFLKKKR